MDEATFCSIVEHTKAKRPLWFQLDSDPPASGDDLARAQDRLSIRFPPEFVSFAKRFGGGYFAFANVYSVNANSDWNIVRRNGNAGLIVRGILACSENGVGDYFGFRVETGICTSRVLFFDHETREICDSPYDDLFDYLVSVGLHGGVD